MTDPVFLDVEDVLLIHEEQLDEYGARREYAIRACWSLPSRCRARRGLLAALVFLDLNGVRLADPSGRLFDAMLAVAEHGLDEAGLAAVLRQLSKASEQA